MGRDEKGKGGGRGDLRERKENQTGERAIKSAIILLRKNGY